MLLRRIDLTSAPVKCQSIGAHAVHRKWLAQTEKQMEHLCVIMKFHHHCETQQTAIVVRRHWETDTDAPPKL